MVGDQSTIGEVVVLQVTGADRRGICDDVDVSDLVLAWCKFRSGTGGET